MVIEDSAGRPATQTYAQEYARAYGFMFTTGYDPTYQLDAYAESSSVPMNIFVDLSTMQIIEIQHGYYSFSEHAREIIQSYLAGITR